MSQLGSFYSTSHSAPRHYGRIGCYVPFQDLVPANYLAPFTIEEFLCTLHAVTLQTVFRRMFSVSFQALCFDTCLALRTFGPTIAWSFVTSDVDILIREQVGYLAQYIFYKLHCFIVTNAKYIFKYSPVFFYFIRTSRTTQFRVSSQSSNHMSGQVYFRDDVDIAFLCIVYNFFNLFLCVETSIRCAVIFTGVVSYYCC